MAANPELLTTLDAEAEDAQSKDTTQAEDSGAAADTTVTADEQAGTAAVAATDEASKPAEQKTVPLAALHEARDQVKALRNKIAELEAQPGLSQEDVALLKELKDARKAATEQEPDFMVDPKGYVDSKVKAALAKLEETEKTTKETGERLTQQQQINAVLSATANAEATFTEKTPDYLQALTHVRTVRTQQLGMLYPDATTEQVQQRIAAEELAAAHHCLTRGKNPAEFAYSYAKTLGYTKAQDKGEKKSVDKEAARTLGSGGGDGAQTETEGNDMPEFSAALQERFRRKK